MTDSGPLLPFENCATLLATMKERNRSAQLRAAVAVNQPLILLYRNIRRDILARDLRGTFLR